MGLSGTLEAFPLSEVLRLLSRSGHTGRLIARSGEKEMRAYLQAGHLVVAWAGSDDALGDELIGRGLIDEADWEDVARGDVACEQALRDGVTALDFDNAVVDITIEGLAKMVDGLEGTFAFEEGAVSDLRLETEVGLDAVLEGVDERLRAWRRLRRIVPDTAKPLAFVRVAPGTTVELSDRAWNLLMQLLPRVELDALIAESGRSSTAFVEDLLELLANDLATIEGFTAPDEVDAALREAEAADEGDHAPSLVPDDPLAGAGPMGWENELASIAAAEGDAEDDDSSTPVPLLEGEDATFLNSAKEAEGFDFGLVGIDLGPVKGRNLLEKDDSWVGILGGGSTSAGGGEEPPIVDEPTAPVDREEETSAPQVIDLGLEAPDDGTLGSVLDRLDEVLIDEEDGPGATTGTPPVDEAAEGDRIEEPDDAPKVETDELLAAVAALGEGLADTQDVEEPDDAVVDLPEDEPELLERVAELLEEAEGLLPEDVEAVPYDAEVVDAAEVGDAAADAEPEEPLSVDGPARGMSNLLRRRARGALAKELRSLSD